MVLSEPSFERGELPLVEHFVNDKDPAYYGRFRLWFAQVAPWFDEYRAIVKVRPGATPELRAAAALLDGRQSWPFQIVNLGKQGAGWSLPPELGAPEDDFLSLELLSDVCYIDMRNVRFALERFSAHLEDAHFFALSVGDGLDRWVDEYRMEGGIVSAERWLWEPDLWVTRHAFFRALAKQRPEDPRLGEFASRHNRGRSTTPRKK